MWYLCHVDVPVLEDQRASSHVLWTEWLFTFHRFFSHFTHASQPVPCHCTVRGRSCWSSIPSHCMVRGRSCWSSALSHCMVRGRSCWSSAVSHCMVRGRLCWSSTPSHCTVRGRSCWSSAPYHCTVRDHVGLVFQGKGGAESQGTTVSTFSTQSLLRRERRHCRLLKGRTCAGVPEAQASNPRVNKSCMFTSWPPRPK